MSKKLYVGSLAYATDADGLKEAFSQAGQVESATVISDKMTGRSKGFGFVEMATEDEAQAAIAMFNGQDLDGRKVIVNEARPMEDRPRTSGGGGFNRGGDRDRDRGPKRW